MTSDLLVQKHRKFLRSCLAVLPAPYSHLETSRPTLLFFALAGLELLQTIDDIDADYKKKAIDWLYSQQLTVKNVTSQKNCGFRGFKLEETYPSDIRSNHSFDSGHLAMNYSALICLIILGDDLSRVDRLGVLANVKACQRHDGSFSSVPDGAESDMRFVYCAAVTCAILNDWRAMDCARTVQYIKTSMNLDGGFGQGPGYESHGGSTFCALAALRLFDRIPVSQLSKGDSCNGSSASSQPSAHNAQFPTTKQLETTVRWCVLKQTEGFHGRTGKEDDSCYTFWIGASLTILNAYEFIDHEKMVAFTLSTQDDVVGGFGKYSDSRPDALHTYLSLSGLSLSGYNGLKLVDPCFNVSRDVKDRLTIIQQSWKPVSWSESSSSSICQF